MAKKQTFGDKLKKKDAADTFPIQVLKWYHDDNRGTLRCLNKFVQLNDINEAATIDINK